MSVSIDSASKLREAFCKYHSGVQNGKKDARSLFFSACGEYYETQHAQNTDDKIIRAKAFGMHNDYFYKEAINKKSQVAHLPNVIAASGALIDQWESLKIRLHMGCSDEELDAAIQELANANYIMADNVICSVKKIYNKYSFPVSLMLCLNALLDWWIVNPEQAMRDLSLLEESAPILFYRIPYQVVMRLLCSPDEIGDLTSIFKPIGKEKIQDWKARFQTLDITDQWYLSVTKIPTDTDEKNPEDILEEPQAEIIPFSIEGQQLFNEIFAEVCALHKGGAVDNYNGEGKEAKASAAYYQFFNELIEKSLRFLSFAEKWAEHCSALKDLPENFQLQDVLQLLQQISSQEYYEVLEKTDAIQHFPELQTDLNIKILEWTTYSHSFYSMIVIAKKWQDANIKRNAL